MTIQGVYLEPVRMRTSDFKEFDQRFGNKLVTLYEINYAEVVSGYLGKEDEWDETTYYHGTSHCGCLDQRIVNPENDRVPVHAWCENSHCTTNNIINRGFLKTKSPRGHFFSPQIETARTYAISKGMGVAPNSPLLSIFVCVTRNPRHAGVPGYEDYHFVPNDNVAILINKRIIELPKKYAALCAFSLSREELRYGASTSVEFLQYQAVFGANKLVKLYKVSYESTEYHVLDHFNGYPSIYYHGTGHCGCVLQRGVDAILAKMNANEWCGRLGCATQGILNNGHLKACSPRGHYFSPNWGTALGYCLQKSGPQALLSMFVVKARYFSPGSDICFVQSDTDILPCFLAVLRYP
ncbi:MAG: hypothetical protein J3R72DRAFT_478546 [Linnemannia gamsii]|nr:MAG: hypothetical protein J3R72DRAFT_478546 [Linnemannia gamsii]